MEKDPIIMNAEKIWQKLENDLRDTNINKLKNDCRLSALEFRDAIVWLIKKDKIKFIRNDNTTYVFPVE
jgi:hypothetical protein